MRLGVLISAAYLALAGCTAYPSNKSIETAVNAFPAIARHFESDFSNNDREGSFTFGLSRDKRGAHGWYEDSTIFMPPCSTSKELASGERALCHEIVHAIMQNLIGHPDYEGPSLDDLKAYTESVMERPSLKEVAKVAKAAAEVNVMLEQGAVAQRQILDIINHDLPRLDDESKKGKRELSELKISAVLEKRIAEFEKENEKLIAGIESAGKGYRAVLDSIKEEEELLKGIDVSNLTREEQLAYIARTKKTIKPVFDAGEENLKQVKAYRDGKIKLANFICDTVERARIAIHDAKIAEYKQLMVKEKDAFRKSSYSADIRLEEERKQDVQQLARMHRRIINFKNDTAYDLGRLLAVSSSHIFTPEEIFARVVSAYGNCNLSGKSSQNEFSLGDYAIFPEEDFEFLRRFKFDGREIFSEVILGFEEAQKLVASGVSAEEARERVLTARYQAGEWRIIGEIPYRQ